MNVDSTIYTNSCILCNPSENEKERTLITTAHWRVVNEDQSLSERILFIPKRHISGFAQLSTEERDDFYKCQETVSKTKRIRQFHLKKSEGQEIHFTGERRTSCMHYHIILPYKNCNDYLALGILICVFGILNCIKIK